MSRRIFGLVIPAVAAIAFLAGGAFSEDPKPPEGGGDPKEMEKAMEALGAPGDMHKWLAKFDGAWNVKGSFTGPDGKSMEATGKATFRMILGGRFQQQDYVGQLSGKTFDGHGVLGYDNLTKQFENFWFDTMGTTPSIARGACSGDGKTLDLTGEWVMPSGQKMAFKFVTTWVSETSFTFQVIMDVGGGNMVPVGELTYTRA